MFFSNYFEDIKKKKISKDLNNNVNSDDIPIDNESNIMNTNLLDFSGENILSEQPIINNFDVINDNDKKR
jgi:hypothetical protein